MVAVEIEKPAEQINVINLEPWERSKDNKFHTGWLFQKQSPAVSQMFQ